MEQIVLTRDYDTGEVRVVEAPEVSVISYGLLADSGAFLGGGLAISSFGLLIVGDINPAVYRPTGFSEEGIVLRKVS